MMSNRLPVLFALFTVLGAVLHFRIGLENAWYLYAAAGLTLAAYLLFGDVWSAFNLLKRGKPEKAQKILDRIFFPDLLLPSHRAYFHFTQGMIFLQRKKLDAAEPHLLKAEKNGLRRPADQALLLLNLAHLNYVRRRFQESRRYLNAAKQQKTDDLLIKDSVGKLEKALEKK